VNSGCCMHFSHKCLQSVFCDLLYIIIASSACHIARRPFYFSRFLFIVFVFRQRVISAVTSHMNVKHSKKKPILEVISAWSVSGQNVWVGKLHKNIWVGKLGAKWGRNSLFLRYVYFLGTIFVLLIGWYSYCFVIRWRQPTMHARVKQSELQIWGHYTN